MNADRDRWLDAPLKHALSEADPASTSASCLDAETAAAWIDGGLDAQGIVLAEAHASSCARCQALLGAVARATPHGPATSRAGVRLWRWWFAPLAAGVAAATLWMVVPPDPVSMPPSAPVNEVARAEPPAPATEPALAAPPTPSRPPLPPAASRGANAMVPTTADQAKLGAITQDTPILAAPEPRAEAPMRADATAERSMAAASPPARPVMSALRLERSALDVVSPDTARRWRAGDDGAVSFSADEGRTWEEVYRATGVDITAGSSPSPVVCWFVGRGGLVLVTADGRRFGRLPFPEATDLAAVTATDARGATLTTVDGRRFATVDGGQSWQRQ